VLPGHQAWNAPGVVSRVGGAEVRQLRMQDGAATQGAGHTKAGGQDGLGEPRLAQSPNCNPYAERFVKTIKYDCLKQFVMFGERHLQHLIKGFMRHYHTERFHQGLGGQLIKGQPGSANDNGSNGSIVRRSRLGGLLNYYHREAA
jgi:Integrase core domain